MSEMSVFDVYRVNRALDGHLEEGDRLELIANDSVTRNFWVLTQQELIVLSDGQIASRLPIDRLAGSVRGGPSGIDVRVHDAKGAGVMIGTFKRSNKLTDRLTALLMSTKP